MTTPTIYQHLTDPSLLQTDSLINGKWQAASDGQTFAVTNPFDGALIAQVASLSADEVRAAVTHATRAQTDWAAQTAETRAKILHQWADLIDANRDDLATIMTLEQGKPIGESRGEIDYANRFIRWFADEGKRVYGDIIPAPANDARIVVLKQPIGVCAAITPWNFPAAMITRKVAPALAAGCAIIVKPAGLTPLTALALGELAQRAGVPAGVLQMVTGKSDVVGDVLTGDARIRKLSFTGSTATGRLLMAQSADTLKKLSMELGGNAPFIVFNDADLDAAAEGLIASKFRNAGQTCVCANRVFVQADSKDAFLQVLLPKVRALQVGNGMDDNTTIGPLINANAVDKVRDLLNDALANGAKLVLGEPLPNTPATLANGAPNLLVEPIVIEGVTDDMAISQQEIFGPVLAIATFDDEAEVIARANDTEFGLASYFYTNDLARSWRVTERLEYGMVGQNTGLISNEVAPFGGVKQSGFGREGSKYGIEEYISVKYWQVRLGTSH